MRNLLCKSQAKLSWPLEPAGACFFFEWTSLLRGHERIQNWNPYQVWLPYWQICSIQLLFFFREKKLKSPRKSYLAAYFPTTEEKYSWNWKHDAACTFWSSKHALGQQRKTFWCTKGAFRSQSVQPRCYLTRANLNKQQAHFDGNRVHFSVMILVNRWSSPAKNFHRFWMSWKRQSEQMRSVWQLRILRQISIKMCLKHCHQCIKVKIDLWRSSSKNQDLFWHFSQKEISCMYAVLHFSFSFAKSCTVKSCSASQPLFFKNRFRQYQAKTKKTETPLGISSQQQNSWLGELVITKAFSFSFLQASSLYNHPFLVLCSPCLSDDVINSIQVWCRGNDIKCRFSEDSVSAGWVTRADPVQPWWDVDFGHVRWTQCNVLHVRHLVWRTASPKPNLNFGDNMLVRQFVYKSKPVLSAIGMAACV